MIKNMVTKFGGIALATLLTLSPVNLQTAFAFDAQEKTEIEQIIHDYLLKNPELMLEIQQALEAKTQAAAKLAAATALKDNRDKIFSSPNQGAIGNPDADVTVVEFFDYNCGFCQRAMQDMNQLLSQDDNIRFVMKELPILSEASVEASRISTAVYRLAPNKYAEFHNTLLALQGSKDGNRALSVANDMGLDVAAIKAESEKENVVDAFREANDLATKLGMNGTPSYVIGDEVLFGALGVEVLRDKIANVRKCGSTNCS